MLVLKYFLVVGVALTVGLFALSAHMTAASVAPVVAPPPPEPEPVVAAPVEQPPQAPAKAGSKSRRSHADRGKRQNGGVALR
jgi:hypothetical protein